MKTFHLVIIIAALGLLAGCSTVPERVDILEDARAAVTAVDQDPLAENVAGNELAQARRSLARAQAALEDREDLEVVRHDAYLALRHAEIVEQRIRETRVREQIEDSQDERNSVLLQARERDVAEARSLARNKTLQAEAAEAAAAANARVAAEKTREADLANARAASAMAAAEQLSNELESLHAEKTARGMVLTLADVLFDTDEAQLKPGARQTLDRLADFMTEYPERELLIEGHTDSRGTDSYNEDLSYRRANAVRRELIDRGIAADRLQVQALGESWPVATNDTPAGRQENRRVEIVISDKEGSFPASAYRDIAQR